MKVCPKCNQSYRDDDLNFCLADGESLLETETQDAPPTIMMDAPRVTNEGSWGTGYDPAEAPHTPQFAQNQQIYQQPPGNQSIVSGQDKTLPTVSLVLGISSLLLICCYLGLPLGAGALITGFIGMNKANRDPQMFGGKELAIIGMVLGGIGLALTVILFILGMLGQFL